MIPPLSRNDAIASGSAGVSPAVFGLWPKTFCREHGDLVGIIEARQKQSARHLFSLVATRTNGARRLRRFRLAQPCDVEEFPERQESADGEAA